MHNGKLEAKRLDILQSAVVAFGRGGYYGTSLADIAETLNMTAANLYYYFKDKEEILYACNAYIVDFQTALLQRITNSPISPDAKLRRLIVSFTYSLTDKLLGTALTLDLKALSPPLRKKIIGKRDRFEGGFREIIKSGIEAGIFHQQDSKLLTFAMLGALNWVPHWYKSGGAVSAVEIGETFADYLIAGLRNNGRETQRSNTSVGPYLPQLDGDPRLKGVNGPKIGGKRLEILKNAAVAFGRSGYHHTTLEEIARNLNMTAANIYRYFRDKEEILFVCNAYIVDSQTEVLKKILNTPLPPEEKLRQVIISFIYSLTDEVLGAALMLDLKALSPPRRKQIIAKRDEFERGFRQIIQRGMETGVFRTEDPKLLTFAILGALNWIPHWYKSQGEVSVEVLAETLADYLIRGLHPPDFGVLSS